MPRKARKKSSMNIYHVILRGINQQIIFEDKHDHVQFISIMKHYKKLCGFKLYAYCLMDNHVHLLIEDADIPLDEIMKKIEVKFVRWYNRKYDQNPLHAGLERVPGVYPWSSYEAYVVTDASFIDEDRVLELYTRNQYLKMLHHAGISKRQLSRLTGISRTVIDKAIRGV